MQCDILDNLVFNNGLVLSVIQQQGLVQPMTSEEIRKTLFDTRNKRASGLDGNRSKFFKVA